MKFWQIGLHKTEHDRKRNLKIFDYNSQTTMHLGVWCYVKPGISCCCHCNKGSRVISACLFSHIDCSS